MKKTLNSLSLNKNVISKLQAQSIVGGDLGIGLEPGDPGLTTFGKTDCVPSGNKCILTYHCPKVTSICDPTFGKNTCQCTIS